MSDFMLGMIVATDTENGIGVDNHLPWYCKQDLMHFYNATKNRVVIMGRSTLRSLPTLLPNRIHIVLTRDTNLVSNDKNLIYVHSIDEAHRKAKEITLANRDNIAYVIGGEQIYRHFIRRVNFLERTVIINRNRKYVTDRKFVDIDGIFENPIIKRTEDVDLNTGDPVELRFELHWAKQRYKL